MGRLFVLKTLSPTQRVNEDQNACGDLPETTAVKSCGAKHERKIQCAYLRSAFPA